jgi:hypothetical protein
MKKATDKSGLIMFLKSNSYETNELLFMKEAPVETDA